MNRVQEINMLIKHYQETEPGFAENEVSDGYHTFDELYEFRKMYHALALKFLSGELRKELVYNGLLYKSQRHSDGELCFGGGWFIVVMILGGKQTSNHYKMEEWDLFDVPEVKIPLHEFDGHTSQDVLRIIRDYLTL